VVEQTMDNSIISQLICALSSSHQQLGHRVQPGRPQETGSPDGTGAPPSNQNTFLNRLERPWLKSAAWSGCKRCWSDHHYVRNCPPVLAGIRFCTFCLNDGHEVGPPGQAECPELLRKRCKLCNKTGHLSPFCDQQTCTLCKQKGHGPTRCPSQKNGPRG
jgi:hypothetical protein